MSLLDERTTDGTVAGRSDDPGRGTSPAPATATHRRRRRVVVAAVLAAVLAAGWWVAPRTVALGADVTPTFGDGTQAVELPQFGEGGSYVLAYEDGAYGSVQIPLRNERPFPVTVHDVRLTDQPRSLAEVVATSQDGGASLPLHLGPGEETVVQMTLRFDNCDYYHERALERLDRAFLEVSVLGARRGVEVTLDRPILVRSPMIVDCPDRLIDRQAKTRLDG